MKEWKKPNLFTIAVTETREDKLPKNHLEGRAIWSRNLECPICNEPINAFKWHSHFIQLAKCDSDLTLLSSS